MLARAEPSFAARREARRLGIAIAAMMPMIATTMSSSIKEKPCWRFCVFISLLVLLKRFLGFNFLAPLGVVYRRRAAQRRKCLLAGLLQGLCRVGSRTRALSKALVS